MERSDPGGKQTTSHIKPTIKLPDGSELIGLNIDGKPYRITAAIPLKAEGKVISWQVHLEPVEEKP